MTTADFNKKQFEHTRRESIHRFRKNCRDYIDQLPRTMKHNLIRELKIAAAAMLLFFCLAGTGIASGDSVNGTVRRIASLVDVERRLDSISAAEIFLVPFADEIEAVALKHNLPPSLIAAFIQEESAFNEWATRTEPAYKRKRKVIHEARKWSKTHSGIPTFYTELDDRSRSYGLVQIMGQTAREQGFSSRYLSELYKPFNSIEQGALVLKNKMARYKNDTLSAISAYNAGTARKKHGFFVNARYVYRIGVAWKVYNNIFIRREHDKNKNFNDRGDLQGSIRDSLVRNNTRLSTARWMFGLLGSRSSEGDTFAFGNAWNKITTGQPERTDRYTLSSYCGIGHAEANAYGSDNAQGNHDFIFWTGFFGVLGFYWLFQFWKRHRTDDAGHRTDLPKSVDERTKIRLLAEFKKTKLARSLRGTGLRHSHRRFDTNNYS